MKGCCRVHLEKKNMRSLPKSTLLPATLVMEFCSGDIISK